MLSGDFRGRPFRFFPRGAALLAAVGSRSSASPSWNWVAGVSNPPGECLCTASNTPASGGGGGSTTCVSAGGAAIALSINGVSAGNTPTLQLGAWALLDSSKPVEGWWGRVLTPPKVVVRAMVGFHVVANAKQSRTNASNVVVVVVGMPLGWNIILPPKKKKNDSGHNSEKKSTKKAKGEVFQKGIFLEKKTGRGVGQRRNASLDVIWVETFTTNPSPMTNSTSKSATKPMSSQLVQGGEQEVVVVVVRAGASSTGGAGDLSSGEGGGESSTLTSAKARLSTATGGAGDSCTAGGGGIIQTMSRNLSGRACRGGGGGGGGARHSSSSSSMIICSSKRAASDASTAGISSCAAGGGKKDAGCVAPVVTTPVRVSVHALMSSLGTRTLLEGGGGGTRPPTGNNLGAGHFGNFILPCSNPCESNGTMYSSVRAITVGNSPHTAGDPCNL